MLRLVLVLAVLAPGYSSSLDAMAMPPDELEDEETRVTNEDGEECGRTFCSIPCEGAAPPEACPNDVPDCPSHCACLRPCLRPHTLECFHTRFCRRRRWKFSQLLRNGTKQAFSWLDMRPLPENFGLE